jgi:hypothetical protein
MPEHTNILYTEHLNTLHTEHINTLHIRIHKHITYQNKTAYQFVV